MILGKHVCTLEINMHGTFEFIFWQPNVISLQINPGLQRPLIHVLKLVYTNTHMSFDCFGNFNIVGIQNKFHQNTACANETDLREKFWSQFSLTHSYIFTQKLLFNSSFRPVQAWA